MLNESNPGTNNPRCDEYAALRDYIQPPMIAVNESYVNADEALHDGDELAFIPPVAGG